MDVVDAEQVFVEAMSSTAKNLRRRSSLAHSIRKSQSIVGIPLEDQISAIDSSASVGERLSQMFQLVVAASVREVQRQRDDDENEGIQNVADHVKAGFLLNSTILPDNHPVIDELSKKLISLTDMIKENDSLKPVSNELNCVKNYMALLNEESNQWREMLTSGKDRCNVNRAFLQRVNRGEILVDDSTRSELPKVVDAELRSLSDGRQELEKLQEQIIKLKTAKNFVKRQLADRRRRVDDLSSEVEIAAKVLCSESIAQFNIDDPVSDIPKIMSLKN